MNTQPDPTTAGADHDRETAVEDALAKLDLTAKVALLAGADMWSLPPNDTIGLGRLVMSDGPAGVRGEHWTPDDPSIAIPSPTAQAATWDPELARRTGRLLAQEARRKGAHVVLAPTVNLHRTPRGGRHFECYSEDPLLSGEIGAALVSGIQDGGVATTPKHFVANDSETDRFTVDVRVDERTLRELYLAPYEMIVRKARPWGMMASYNQVNGASMTENDAINNGVVRGEWGFDGVLVSDWTGARDTVRTALGGLDIAMPGPGTVYGEHLVAAVREGRVPLHVVDDMARRVLRLAARVGLLGGAPAAVPAAKLPAAVDGEGLAREIAVRSFVLLRNEGGVLPLPAAPERIAVVGTAAVEPRTGGGGSAEVFPTRTTCLLDELQAALPTATELVYAPGVDPRVHVPPAAIPLTAELLGKDGELLATTALRDGTVRWMGELPDEVAFADLAAVRLAGTLVPQGSGAHRLSVRGVGRFHLEAGDRVLFDGVVEPDGDDPAGAFLNPPERVFEIELTAGRSVGLRLRHTPPARSGVAGFGMLSFTLGHAAPARTEEELIAEAVEAAAAADVAVVVVATTEEVESEGADRTNLSLPGRQDELVTRVAAANARTVVVVNAGSPVLMPWRDEVAGVLLTWFPGQEGGAALADVLLGHAEPGGRLPTTWPAEEADSPVQQVEPEEGELTYGEGLFIGYRAWERSATAPAYWFGHGLGYTDWAYESLEVRRVENMDAGDPYEAAAEVTVRIRNTGKRAGREIVQLYLAHDGTDPSRPARHLAAFAAVEADAGESAVARMRIPLRELQTWDTAAGGWRMSPGTYAVEAGRSIVDRRLSAALEVPEGA
ncbi:glycoside hydrolase family 3 C-terminal domain-containing protein [Streptomyces sp. NPDC048623]|uniref:beta-glucosidase family protein n=1 Tax=Streptomyces sp. NPDC048623 TaxID=3155761 RepID=UPI003436F29F